MRAFRSALCTPISRRSVKLRQTRLKSWRPACCTDTLAPHRLLKGVYLIRGFPRLQRPFLHLLHPDTRGIVERLRLRLASEGRIPKRNQGGHAFSGAQAGYPHASPSSPAVSRHTGKSNGCRRSSPSSSSSLLLIPGSRRSGTKNNVFSNFR